jgi:hypothetical protein
MGSAICRASGLDRACLERAGLAVDMRHPNLGVGVAVLFAIICAELCLL